MPLPFADENPSHNNVTNLGFYEGVDDDHGSLISNGTWVSMNEIDVAVLSYTGDTDLFKIKSTNLPNEGILEISVNKNPYGSHVGSYFISPTGINNWLSVHFLDGTVQNISPVSTEIM